MHKSNTFHMQNRSELLNSSHSNTAIPDFTECTY